MTASGGSPDRGAPVDRAVPQTPGDVDRYPAIELETGDVVIYDQELATAWIQADNAVPVPDP